MKYEKSLKNSSEVFVKIIKAILIGLFTCVAINSILLVTSAFLFVKAKNIPSASVLPLAAVLSSISSFLGAYTACKILKQKGLIYGAIIGFLFFVLLFFSGLIMAREPLSIMTLIKLVLLPVFGSVGGIVAVNNIKF